MKVQNWSQYKYFDSYEFDSPDEKGSGSAMEDSFIEKLNRARDIAGKQGRLEGIRIIFDINSGVRTPSHNKIVGGASNSSHLTGWAADIKVKNNRERRIILNALIAVGLDRRIGIADTFIHVDDDPTKGNSYWTYPSKKGWISLIKNIFSKNEPEDI